jgi:DNA-directed RNA polymerase specialized sigma24 family protein
MNPLPTVSQLKEFEDALVQWYRENCNKLIRRFYGKADVDEIRSTIHQVLAEIYDEYRRGKSAPDNLGGTVHVRVHNKLIDYWRKNHPEVFAGEDEIDAEERDPFSDWPNLPVSPEEQAAWKQLFRIMFDRVPPEWPKAKWHRVLRKIMKGCSPEEIGEEFGQNGYSLRRNVRKHIRRILTELADAGDGLAHRLAQDFCPG